MANSQVAMTEGSGKNAATYSISEGTTKEIQRMALNTNAGVEIGTSAAPVQVTLANTGANATAVKVDNTVALDKGSGTGGSATQRVIVDSSQLSALGSTTSSASTPVVIASDQLAVATKAAINTFVDGANVTLGAKADAKSTATDTTAITVMQVLKQISASVQAPPSQAVTNAGTFATQAINGGSQYETVAVSQSNQVMGATGAAGDYLSHVIVSPITAGCGVVTILDNATAVVSFPGGGTTALSNLIPFVIPVGIVSTSGAWKITTGANVTAVGVGRFT